MCTELLPPGDNPTAVNKYIKKYSFIKQKEIRRMPYRIMVETPEGNRPFRRPRLRWENNI
jgi:hypothetical protein